MLKLKTKPFIALISLIFWATACTTQAWYEGGKMGAENNCRNQPESERERCMENLNKKSYEEYEKARTEQAK